MPSLDCTTRELIWQLTKLLHAALPLLDAEAAREERQEAGKTLRCVTARNRALAARAAVADAMAFFSPADPTLRKDTQ